MSSHYTRAGGQLYTTEVDKDDFKPSSPFYVFKGFIWLKEEDGHLPTSLEFVSVFESLRYSPNTYSNTKGFRWPQ